MAEGANLGGGLIWLLWRQNRGALAIVAVALVATTCGLVGWHAVLQAGFAAHNLSQCQSSLVDSVCAGRLRAYIDDFQQPTFVICMVPWFMAAYVGAFVGAPAVARELEAGTHRFVWAQVPQARWLTYTAGGIIALGLATGGAIGALLPWALGPLITSEGLLRNGSILQFPLFDASGLAPAGVCVFAGSVGLIASVLTKRTVIAMGLSLLVVAGVSVLVAGIVRPHFESPIMTVADGSGSRLTPTAVPAGAWILRSGDVDASGHPVVVVPNQFGVIPPASSGVRGKSFYLYQPPDRYWTFQTIQALVFGSLSVGLTAGLRPLARLHLA